MSGTAPSPYDLILHACAVSWQGQGALIQGASGTGKSSLALQLMAYGCDLISDDRTIIRRLDARLTAMAPKSIEGQIEARGTGILPAQTAGPNQIVLVVDLDHKDETRIPPRRSTSYIGVELPMVYRSDHPAFAAVVLQLLKTGGMTL